MRFVELQTREQLRALHNNMKSLGQGGVGGGLFDDMVVPPTTWYHTTTIGKVVGSRERVDVTVNNPDFDRFALYPGTEIGFRYPDFEQCRLLS